MTSSPRKSRAVTVRRSACRRSNDLRFVSPAMGSIRANRVPSLYLTEGAPHFERNADALVVRAALRAEVQAVGAGTECRAGDLRAVVADHLEERRHRARSRDRVLADQAQ